MTDDKQPPVAFASFVERRSAVDAKELFQGIRFDPATPTPLKIEFAKSNSKAKRLPPNTFFYKRTKGK
jgi:uncharacterized protein YpiB (UPF0302 family)